jgi:hypothetical protein
MSVSLRGRAVELDSRKNPLDHDYAMTSHSRQGQTTERVLISQEYRCLEYPVSGGWDHLWQSWQDYHEGAGSTRL